MSKLARTLTLTVMVAAMNLPALAHAHPTDQHSGQAGATVRRLLARERFSIPDQTPAPEAAAHQRLLAQERDNSTLNDRDASTPAPAAPSGQSGWLTPALAVLSAVLALVAVVAVLAARRTRRSQRAEQTA